MSAQSTVRIVHIRGTQEGLDKLEQDLRSVSDAQDNLAKSSETVARTTETTSRRQLSAAGAYDRLRGQIDSQFRAQSQLERGQQTLDRAFQQGLATQAEYNRAMGQLRERYLSATAANDNFRASNDNTAASVDQSTGLIDRLKSSVSQLVLAYLSFQGVKMLGNMADQWSEIQARVVNATGSFEGGQAVLERLGQMARRTYSDLDRTAESWLSSSTSLTALGVSISDQLDLVESFNNALVISATRGQRAESVQRAWSDAISLGKMNLDQFNTVMTGSDRLAQALADSMGVNVLELRKMASDGKITREVMLGLSSQLETLREEADRMPATIADGMTLIRNSLLMTIGMMDQAGGASESFAAGLVIIADNMQRMVTYAATAATAYGTYYVGAMVAAQLATHGLTGALALLRTALIRIGIGAAVVLLGELVHQLIEARRSAESWGDAFADIFDRSKSILNAFSYYWQSAVAQLGADWNRMLASIVEGTEWALSGVLGLLGVATDGLGDRARELRQEAEAAAALSVEMQGKGDAAWNHAFRSRESSTVLPAITTTATLPSTVDDKGLAKAAREAKKLEEAYDRLTSKGYDFIRQQELEAQLIGLTTLEANSLRYAQDCLGDAKRADIKFSAGQRIAIQKLAAAHEQENDQ
ncbi:tape measure protein [Aliihoeflea aestuarii]|uniref:tape measure protein n=1 Tax=Aliihoeflea aestuarii TaxID=453840 RepID=UPI002093EA23|nr:tape measure protein [Aliihoeflea aestuarii]MCO6389442.1 tape measure protein [Aliihoeflea aestuarii]